MDFDRKHRLEVASIKRQMLRAQRHTKKAEAIAQERKKVVINIRDDISHFCREWLECLKLLKGDWRSMDSAKRLWFEYCQTILPASEEDLLARLKNSRLFENGHLPAIKNPRR